MRMLVLRSARGVGSALVIYVASTVGLHAQSSPSLLLRESVSSGDSRLLGLPGLPDDVQTEAKMMVFDASLQSYRLAQAADLTRVRAFVIQAEKEDSQLVAVIPLDTAFSLRLLPGLNLVPEAPPSTKATWVLTQETVVRELTSQIPSVPGNWIVEIRPASDRTDLIVHSISDEGAAEACDLYVLRPGAESVWQRSVQGLSSESAWRDSTVMEGSTLYLAASMRDDDSDGLSSAFEILVSGTNPELADSDGDGMPDGFEVAGRLNPLVADGDGDADRDGQSNLIEMKRGTDPFDAGSLAIRTYYVDASQGDDSRDGLAATVRSAAAGPLRTVNAALRRVQKGDRLVVAGGHYPEDVDFGGADVELVFTGDVDFSEERHFTREDIK